MQEVLLVLLLRLLLLIFLSNINLLLLHRVKVKQSFKTTFLIFFRCRLELSKLILAVLLLHV